MIVVQLMQVDSTYMNTYVRIAIGHIVVIVRAMLNLKHSYAEIVSAANITPSFMAGEVKGVKRNMPYHVSGYETSASEAALTAITPIPDGIVQIQGNDILVPSIVNQVGYCAAMINSAAATLRVQLTSPSLKAFVPIDVSPIANGLVFPGPATAMRYMYAPVPLVTAEPLDALVQNGAAVMNRVFVWFTDGPAKPISAQTWSLRFTTSITLATATWANGALTFATALPAGNYKVVGLRLVSTNGCAARLFFKGSFFRPGCPVSTADAVNEWSDFRWGNTGIWDQFNNVTPPSVDVMGITDTAQIGYLDIIKA